MKQIVLLGTAISLAFLVGCSSDDHSAAIPVEEEQIESSSSVSLEDIEDILNRSSSSSAKTDKKKTSDPDEDDDDDPSSNKGKNGSQNSDSGDVTSSSSRSSSGTENFSLKRSACDSKTDENTLMALDLINEKAFRMFESITKKNMEKVFDISAEVKPMYRAVLVKEPKNCNAQLGYAVASIVDLANNETLRNLYDDYKFWYDYKIESVAEFVDMVEHLSTNNSFTKTAQNALEKEVEPMVDSAIVFMQNIMAQGNYALQIKDGDYIREMDNSEFGIALGGLFAAKAAVTIATSLNLEIDNDGRYKWINNLDGLTVGKKEPTAAQKAGLVKIVNLLGLNGTFARVYTNKQKAWKNVPNLVDSALVEIKAAFEYSLEESKTRGAQDYDLYVVGKGADADISTSDVNEIIDNLKKGLKAARGPYDVEIKGRTITVNARKFFENTDVVKNFLPYYKFDGSDLETFYFTDSNGKVTASLMEFLDGTRDFPEEAKDVVVFRDPTFGGIFPYFDQQDVWDFFDKDKGINLKKILKKAMFWRHSENVAGSSYEVPSCSYYCDDYGCYYDSYCYY